MWPVPADACEVAIFLFVSPVVEVVMFWSAQPRSVLPRWWGHAVSWMECKKYQFDRRIFHVHTEDRVSFVETKKRSLLTLIRPNVTCAPSLNKPVAWHSAWHSFQPASAAFISQIEVSKNFSANGQARSMQQKRFRSDGTPATVRALGWVGGGFRGVGSGRHHFSGSPGCSAAGTLEEPGRGCCPTGTRVLFLPTSRCRGDEICWRFREEHYW